MDSISNNTARWPRGGWRSLAAGVGLALSSVAALGIEGLESVTHTHLPLRVSPELTWGQLIDTTLLNYPRFVELAARDAEARAWTERATRWLAGQPSIVITYQSDQLGSGAGLREYESGVELPLWRRGQRQAVRSLGVASTAESTSAAMALRLEVTGLLRAVLWDIEQAENAVALAEDALAVAAELVRVVERRHMAGDLPLSDTLLVRSAMLEREAALIDGEAELLDAERAYRSLTGLHVRPASFTESLTTQPELDASHPRLALATAEIERARAERDLLAGQAKGAPSLIVGPRRERAALTNFYTDSLGVTVSIPFGGQAHANTQTAAAARRVAQAEANGAQLMRQLDLGLHEARHNLAVIDDSLQLAVQRAELAERHRRMSETAFAQGEISLVDLLRHEESARIAQWEATRLEIARERAIAEINQAMGESP